MSRMKHDWVPRDGDAKPGSYAWRTADDWQCVRCGVERHYWETNIPCGTRDRVDYRDRSGKLVKSEPPCVERDE